MVSGRGTQGGGGLLESKSGIHCNTDGENTGNLVCSSCIQVFPDSKGKRYFDICRENSQFFLPLDKSDKSVFCM